MYYLVSILAALIILYFIGVTTCKISTRNNHSVSNKDCFNPMKWVDFVVGTFLKWLIPPHVVTQLYIRLNNDKCQPCRIAGKCQYCGCNVPDKMYVPWLDDSNGYYNRIYWNKEKAEAEIALYELEQPKYKGE